ncbi:MAG: AraC family transcriptional regulator [Clostridiales bacterium]|nr:AraC family transcriptional regulator [Clostridiales bacterium]
MDDRLQERAQRGTVLYPLELYQMTNGGKRMFVPYHWHREIELIFVSMGSLVLTVDDEKFSAGPGDVFWVGQERLHGILTAKEETRYCALLFPMEFLSFEMFDYAQGHYLNPLCRKEKQFPVQIPRGGFYGELWHELREITAQDQKRAQGYQFAIKAALLKLISLLVQAGLLLPYGGKGEASDFKVQNLKAILSYIQRHYAEKLELADMAREFHLSPKYFSRYFKQNLDRPFVAYRNGYRIKRAAELLLSAELPVGEVALAVGFDNFSYFIRQFKAFYGCTPSHYRKKEQAPSGHQHAPLFPG